MTGIYCSISSAEQPKKPCSFILAKVLQDEETSLESEDVRERGVAMHDGSVLQLQLDQETPAYLFVQQQGRGEASQHMYSPYLLCPEQVSGMSVQNLQVSSKSGSQSDHGMQKLSYTQEHCYTFEAKMLSECGL